MLFIKPEWQLKTWIAINFLRALSKYEINGFPCKMPIKSWQRALGNFSNNVIGYCYAPGTNYALMSQDFLDILSRVSRGTVQEKLQWIFGLYDINGDGLITKAEMLDVVTSIYAMVGRYTDPQVEENSAKEHVEKLFYVSTTVLLSSPLFPTPFNKEKTWLTNFITLVFFFPARRMAFAVPQNYACWIQIIG